MLVTLMMATLPIPASAAPLEVVIDRVTEVPVPRAQPTPALPPSPPLPPGSVKAAPKGNPGAWVLSEDYPPDAMRGGLEGTAAFKLDIDEQGAVSACTVTSSSGSQSLDDATCRLIKERAAFSPAKRPDGTAIASTYNSRVRWQIPKDSRRVEPQYVVMRLRVADDGHVIRCDMTGSTLPEKAQDYLCQSWSSRPVPSEALKKMRGDLGRGAITVLSEDIVMIAGSRVFPMAAKAPGHRMLELIESQYDVAPDGQVENCRTTLSIGAADGSPDICGQIIHQNFLPPMRRVGKKPPQPYRAHVRSIHSIAIETIAPVPAPTPVPRRRKR